MEYFVDGVGRYFVVFGYETAFFCLDRFLRYPVLEGMRWRYVSEPFLNETEGVLLLYIAADGEDGIVGSIVAVEECFHVFQSCPFDVFRRDADGCPAIGMHFVSQGTKF